MPRCEETIATEEPKAAKPCGLVLRLAFQQAREAPERGLLRGVNLCERCFNHKACILEHERERGVAKRDNEVKHCSDREREREREGDRLMDRRNDTGQSCSALGGESVRSADARPSVSEAS